jgi:hypothetical protein
LPVVLGPHRFRTAFFVAPALAAVVLTACSSGGKHATATTTVPKSTTTTTLAKLRVGSVHVESAGPDAKVDAATQRAVMTASQQYVNTAVFAPLRTGAVNPVYLTLFDLHVRGPATTTDRAALTDAEVGKATKGYRALLSPVRIDAIADQGGHLLYVATSFRLLVDTTTATGPVQIVRSTELTFAPAGKTWKVTAYRVVATRRAPRRTTTTTAHAPRTTTTRKP